MNALEVKNVVKQYAEHRALDNVSLSLPEKSIYCLLGPNGAGKSTMMKIITTYIPSDNGNVEVSGFDVDSKPIDVRKRVGYLPESNPLYYEMYIREYLSFVGGMYGI